MRIVGIMPVRNEAWVLGLTARAALMWLDELVMLDHASTDRSVQVMAEVNDEFPGRVTILREYDPIWFEAQHRQRLLEAARGRGASHIAIVDADEVLTGNLLDRIRPTIAQTPAGSVFQPPWVCLARSIKQYYAAGPWFNNWVSTAFADDPRAHWKSRDGYDFHHRHPMGVGSTPWRPIKQGLEDHAGGLMHLQFLSYRRLKAKQALYKLTERLRWPTREPVETVDARYNLAVYQSDPVRVAVRPCRSEWWTPYNNLLEKLDIDGEPWQEQVCRDMLDQRPDLRLGLDLFGVV